MYVLQLPSNYNFEIPKTVWRIKSCGAKRGLLRVEVVLLFSSISAYIKIVIMFAKDVMSFYSVCWQFVCEQEKLQMNFQEIFRKK